MKVKNHRIIHTVLNFMQFLICLLIVSLCLSACAIEIYETNDVADYGNITGNYDNKWPQEIIFSFFPKRIEDYFSDVVYHYRAVKFDSCSCEAYLEFTISDKDQFMEYLERLDIPEGKTKPFEADSLFTDYSLEQHLDIDRIDQKSDWSIDYSHTCKILYSKEQQKFIFWALLVYDGGGTDTSDLDFFFKRFNISPDTYATDLREGLRGSLVS